MSALIQSNVLERPNRLITNPGFQAHVNGRIPKNEDIRTPTADSHKFFVDFKSVTNQQLRLNSQIFFTSSNVYIEI